MQCMHKFEGVATYDWSGSRSYASRRDPLPPLPHRRHAHRSTPPAAQDADARPGDRGQSRSRADGGRRDRGVLAGHAGRHGAELWVGAGSGRRAARSAARGRLPPRQSRLGHSSLRAARRADATAGRLVAAEARRVEARRRRHPLAALPRRPRRRGGGGGSPPRVVARARGAGRRGADRSPGMLQLVSGAAGRAAGRGAHQAVDQRGGVQPGVLPAGAADARDTQLAQQFILHHA